MSGPLWHVSITIWRRNELLLTTSGIETYDVLISIASVTRYALRRKINTYVVVANDRLIIRCQTLDEPDS
jgi:hypothetical protein